MAALFGGPTASRAPTSCPPPPGVPPHHEKAQGRPPMVTVTLLPAFRWFPSMAIQVPPERGPRAGITREKVGVCRGKGTAPGAQGPGPKPHSQSNPEQGTGTQLATKERDPWDSNRARCHGRTVPAGLQGQPWRNTTSTAQLLPRAPPRGTGASFLPRGSPHTPSIASIPQQPPTRCQPCLQHGGTPPALTTKVKLLGEVAR